MATRNLILAGVASLALAGGMIAATPGFAQDVEQMQTGALNLAQAAPVPPAPAPGDKAAYDAAMTQYNAQLREYEAKKRAYEQEQKNYRTRTQAYGVQSDIYQNDRAAFDDTVVEQPLLDAPVVIEGPVPAAGTVVTVPRDGSVVIQKSSPSGTVVIERRTAPLVELATLRNPDAEIAGAPVEDRTGYVVGHFKHMTFQDDGIPKGLITLNNNKTIAVRDDHLKYDPAAAVVVADMTYEELQTMPARF